MNRDQVVGAGVFAGSILGILAYAYLLFMAPYSELVLKLTAFVAVAAVLAILAWIGYTLATTPPPPPLEEIEKEMEEETKEESKE